jgi:hypothetical protein
MWCQHDSVQHSQRSLDHRRHAGILRLGWLDGLAGGSMTPTGTPLEAAVDAAVCTLMAWAYPSDDELRMAAVSACGLCGVDYIDRVAQLTEHLDRDNYNPDHAHTARWLVAQAALAGLEVQRRTMVPRMGVLGNGEPA